MFLKYDSRKSDHSYSGAKRNVLKSSLTRPTALTLFRFGGSLLFGIILHPNLKVLERIKQTKDFIPDFTLPAALLFIANYANSISLNRIGISLTYTSKCAIPLITVLLTLLIDGKKALPNVLTLSSLVPIALGIAVASWNSPTFEKLGFLAAMISTTSQAALNVTSKQAMSKTGLTGSQAQRAMVAVGFVITIALSILQRSRSNTLEKESREQSETELPLWLTTMAVLAYHAEYVLSFMFVKLVSPITYGTCDAMRRLSIIVSGHRMFGGPPFSGLNLFGIGLALLGALGYSIASNK
jgi:hypothetical protein